MEKSRRLASAGTWSATVRAAQYMEVMVVTLLRCEGSALNGLRSPSKQEAEQAGTSQKGSSTGGSAKWWCLFKPRGYIHNLQLGL